MHTQVTLHHKKWCMQNGNTLCIKMFKEGIQEISTKTKARKKTKCEDHFIRQVQVI